ncbi:monocarboxylate transporter 10 [Ciona intestinalis]
MEEQDAKAYTPEPERATICPGVCDPILEPEGMISNDIECHQIATVPDGGWGWVVTFAAFTINIVVIGIHNCFSLLYIDMITEFKGSLSKTAWIGSIAFGCILIFAPLSGVLANRFGCRKVTLAGIVIASTFLFASSFATSIESLFLTYGFGFGFGTSLAYMQGAVMVTRYFNTKRALASGICLAGSSLGTLVIAPIYNILSTNYGWRVALKVLGGGSLSTVLCAATYRPLNEPSAAPRSTQERIQSSPAKGLVMELALWKNKAFLVWCLAVGLCKLGYLVPWVHMIKLCSDIGISRPHAASMLQYMSVTSTISRLVAGKLADSRYINRLYLSQFSACMMGVVTLLQPSMYTQSGVLAYAIMFGTLDGGVEILLPVMTLDLVGADQLSVAWGCILAVISLSSLGPPVAGAIRDQSGSYMAAFYFAGAPMVLSAFILLLIPLWAKRQEQIIEQSYLSIDPTKMNTIQEMSDHYPPKHSKHFKAAAVATLQQCSNIKNALKEKLPRRDKSSGKLLQQRNRNHSENIPINEIVHQVTNSFHDIATISKNYARET